MGNQLRDGLLRWRCHQIHPLIITLGQSPSRRHSSMVLSGSKFREWKSTGSFLWIHGEHAFFSAYTSQQLMVISHFHSELRKKRTLVRPSFSSNFSPIFTWPIQFFDHSRHYGLAGHQEGLDGVFLFRLQGRRPAQSPQLSCFPPSSALCSVKSLFVTCSPDTILHRIVEL